MANKKDKEEKKSVKTAAPVAAELSADGKISTRAELKSFLTSVRDRMTEHSVPPIFAASAVNFVLTLPNVYEIMDNDNKEIARDIWLRIKQAGMQLRNPPLLFGEDGAAV